MLLANIISAPKRALKFVSWWLIWNVPLGKIGPFITSIALWRWGEKTKLHPNPFAADDCDVVIVTGTENHNGMWVQCHHCKGGFLAFDNYMKYLLLVKEELPKTPSKEAISRIEVICPNCRGLNSYWFYPQYIKDLYNGPENKRNA
jgi:hypothetical protein